MPKPKVLIVGKLPPPYIGPAIATQILLQSDLNEEYQIIHFNNSVNRSVDEFGKLGLKKFFKNIALYFRFWASLKNHKPQLVLLPISQTTLGFVKDSILILMASLLAEKVLLQLRGSNLKNWLNSSTALTKEYVRFCLQRTNGVVVLGEKLRYLFEPYFEADSIFVVPNGCDIDFPIKETNQNNEVKLLYFSNLLESKGLGDIVEAVSILLNDEGLNFSLDAVGSWYDQTFQNHCKQKVERENLPIYFHPPTSGDRKWKFFNAADVFVFTPNKPEGHPWSIVEAMAASLPIISTDQGAITESVIEGENGFIVDVHAPNEIASRLKKLIKEKTLLSYMGDKSQQYYQEKFTEKPMVKKLSHAFQQLLKR
jgi:glycosyltransferase involved in cell wall biosynthesis